MKNLFFIMLNFTYFFSCKESNLNTKQLLKKGIDNNLPIYVINLDRSPERYKPLKDQLEKFNLPHARFSAVDGHTLQIEDENGISFTGKELIDGKKKLLPKKRYNISCPGQEATYISDISYPNIKHDILTPGEFGCFFSHLGVSSEIVFNNLPYALILEDDCFLEENFTKNLTNIIDNLPNDWDVIYLYLGFCHLNGDFIEISEEKFLDINNLYLKKLRANSILPNGTQAMLVSNSGAKKIKKFSSEFTIPIDLFLSTLVNENKINAYKSIKNCVYINDKISSEIDKMGRKDGGRKTKD